MLSSTVPCTSIDNDIGVQVQPFFLDAWLRSLPNLDDPAGCAKLLEEEGYDSIQDIVHDNLSLNETARDLEYNTCIPAAAARIISEAAQGNSRRACTSL